MSDLDKVMGLAEEKRRQLEDKLTAQREESQKRQDLDDLSIELLSTRIKQFAKELHGKVGIYVKSHCNAATQINRELVVSISSAHPLIRKPYCVVRIGTSSNAGEYHCNVERSNKQEHFGALELEAVVAVISDIAAEYISNRAALTYELPPWYSLTGEIIGWPVFLFTWIIFTWLGGGLGFVLGFLAGLILRYAAKFLWLPGLVILFFKIQG